MDVMIKCECGQQFPPDREHCPYCDREPKRYWYLENGEMRQAIVQEGENGRTLISEGEVIESGQGFPKGLKHLETSGGGFWEKFRRIRRKMLLGFFRATGQMPKDWDEWLEADSGNTELVLGKDFDERK